MAQAPDKAAATERRTDYTKWLDGGATYLQNGAIKLPGRAACRFIRSASGWTPPARGDKRMNAWQKEHPNDDDPDDWEDLPQAECANETLLNHQAEVEVAANEWAKLWKEEEPQFQPPSGPLDSTLPELTAQDIRAAAETFPVDTGLGADNISPRALAFLPDEQLRDLAGLLTKCERDGSWPENGDSCLLCCCSRLMGGADPSASSRP